jgi:hypothetical protein
MTLKQLRKHVESLIAAGHGNKQVYINKDTFAHPWERYGCVILNVRKIKIKTYVKIDDDGSVMERKNGEECTFTAAVLLGDDDDEDITIQDDKVSV